MKRSNQPIFWSLFGAGGMLVALVGTGLVLVTGLAAPLGFAVPDGLLAYDRVLAFAQHWLGKAFLFAVIALFTWQSVHRIYHGLHDLGIRAGMAAQVACYGFALAVTLVSAWSLLAIGF